MSFSIAGKGYVNWGGAVISRTSGRTVTLRRTPGNSGRTLELRVRARAGSIGGGLYRYRLQPCVRPAFRHGLLAV